LKFQASWVKTFARPHLNGRKLGVVVYIYYTSNGGKLKTERSRFRPVWTKIKTLSTKQPEQKGLEQ
jgi:hypothetical protein